MSIIGEMPTNLPPAELSDAETIRRGVERRKQWWQVHSKEYDLAPAQHGDASGRNSTRLPVMNFSLKNLNGNVVRLSDFRGKVVLVNFWATWCASCLTEIGDLNALQKRLGDRVGILGIALDGVPNVEDPQDKEKEEGTGKTETSLEAITAKIKRTVSSRGINYTVLLDPEGSVGGQYNGGELPATVIVDKDGRVRRRFNGGRSVEVLEAMVQEAGKESGEGRKKKGEAAE
jgi:thiol-disulfide isomerase/thioredoxin